MITIFHNKPFFYLNGEAIIVSCYISSWYKHFYYENCMTFFNFLFVNILEVSKNIAHFSELPIIDNNIVLFSWLTVIITLITLHLHAAFRKVVNFRRTQHFIEIAFTVFVLFVCRFQNCADGTFSIFDRYLFNIGVTITCNLSIRYLVHMFSWRPLLRVTPSSGHINCYICFE